MVQIKDYVGFYPDRLDEIGQPTDARGLALTGAYGSVRG
jgi:hypothetical protein